MARLTFDVLGLSILIVAIQKAWEISGRRRLFRVFFIIEALFGFGTLAFAWIDAGANPRMTVIDLLDAARLYLLVSWTFVFALTPATLALLGLFDLFVDFGGRCVRGAPSLVLSGILLCWVVIPIPGESISGWPHIVAAVIEGLGFSLVILVFAAMWRRRHLRIGPNLRRPLRAPLTYVWQRDQVLDVGQLQWISRQFHQWPGVEASKGAHPMRGMR